MSINPDAIPFEAYKGTDPYIFVSYSHKDTKIVSTDIKLLHDKGYRIWYDEGISPAKEWSDEIAIALEKSAVFIYFVSPRSVDSKNCRDEAHFALDKDKPFLAIHIEETKLTGGLMLRMNSTQAVMRHRVSADVYHKKLDKVLDVFNVKDISPTLIPQSTPEPTTLISSNVSPTIDEETVAPRLLSNIYQSLNTYLKWWLKLPILFKFALVISSAFLVVFMFFISAQLERLRQQNINANSNTSIQNQNGATGNEVIGDNESQNENVNITSPDTPGDEGKFTILLQFEGNLTEKQKSAFKAAASRWTKIIVGDLPPAIVDGETIDDLLIMVQGVDIDGRGKIIGQAGPTRLRPKSMGTVAYLPVKGIISIDNADLALMEKDGTLEDFAAHEIGGVLGIGKLDKWRELVQGAYTSNPVFIGKNARREYAVLLGVSKTSSVPVENIGGEGTKDVGWRETVFMDEIMTGFISGNGNLISRVTVGALEDMGYTVDYAGAENYKLPNKPSN